MDSVFKYNLAYNVYMPLPVFTKTVSQFYRYKLKNMLK